MQQKLASFLNQTWSLSILMIKHKFGPRTTDTQWRHKSKISENLGRCSRQNMLQPYLKIWDLELIFGCVVKAISSLGVHGPWFGQYMANFYFSESSEIFWISLAGQLFKFIKERKKLIEAYSRFSCSCWQKNNSVFFLQSMLSVMGVGPSGHKVIQYRIVGRA